MPVKLFGSNITPACKYCNEAIQVFAGGTQALCRRKGVVSASSQCRAFSYDPLKRVPRRQRPLQSFTSEDFSL